MQEINKEYVNWDLIHLYTQIISSKTSLPNLIIGVAGGGIIPASMVARDLKIYNLQFIGLSSYNSDHTQANDIRLYSEPDLSSQHRDQKILVIDDILDSGRTFKFIQEYFFDKGYKNIQYAVLHHKIKPLQYIPDNLIYATQCESNTWIQYAWELD